jgi:hypothetical protein
VSAVVVGGAEVCVVVAGAVVDGAGAVVDGPAALAGVLDAGATDASAAFGGVVVSYFARRVVDVVDDDASATTAAELAVESVVMAVSVFARPNKNAPTATVTTTAPTRRVVIA